MRCWRVRSTPSTCGRTPERRSSMFRDVVTDLDDLRALLGAPSEVALKKQITRLDAHCRAIIAHAPFVVLGTAGARGRCDAPPKGDPPRVWRLPDATPPPPAEPPGSTRLAAMRTSPCHPP